MKKFFSFFKTTAGIVILVLVIIAIVLIYLNWDTIKAWWNAPEVPVLDNSGPPATDTTRLGTQLVSVPILDANGNPTGGYYQVSISSDARAKVPCQKVSTVLNGITYTGWIGDCKYPIGAQ